MAVTKQTEAIKQITFLAGALKAPRITDAATRLPIKPATRAGRSSTTSPPS